MSTAQRAILLVSNVCLLAALVGLVARQRWRLIYSFPVYLLAVILLSPLAGLWPERFHTWSFFWFKQWVYSALETTVALELTLRVFQAFPSARRVARAVFLVILAVTLIAALTAPIHTDANENLQQQWAD